MNERLIENHVLACCKTNKNLFQILEKFWPIENLYDLNPRLWKEDFECEKFYDRTVFRNNENRFTISLPFKDNPTSFTFVKCFQT